MTAMMCPRCGIEMNHHADKLVLPSDPQEAPSVDPVLGGMIEELHACPRCGCCAARRAEPARGQ